VLTISSVCIENIIKSVNTLFNNNFCLDFIRKSLPVNLIHEYNDVTIDKFLNTWSADNHVRALVMQPGSPLRIRYALIALEYRNHINFG